MPYMYVEPEEFVRTPRGAVYHVYKDDMWDNPMVYWYTTDPLERDEYVFDVRDLAPGSALKTLESIKQVIIENCDKLRFPDDI